MSLDPEIVRENQMRHEDMRQLIALEAAFSATIQPIVADRMLSLLNDDEKEGHHHPPGYVALMEAAKESLRS